MKNGPLRLISFIRSHSASVTSRRWCCLATPAMLPTMSIPPWASTQASTAARISDTERTSTWRVLKEPPADVSSSDEVSVMPSSLTSTPNTVAPSAASRRAVARPTPLATPVRKATLFMNRVIGRDRTGTTQSGDSSSSSFLSYVAPDA